MLLLIILRLINVTNFCTKCLQPKLIEILSFRNALYSRYSTQDWDASNKANYSLSEREKSSAERLRADAWRSIKSTEARTRNRQQSNTKRLGMNSQIRNSYIRVFLQTSHNTIMPTLPTFCDCEKLDWLIDYSLMNSLVNCLKFIIDSTSPLVEMKHTGALVFLVHWFFFLNVLWISKIFRVNLFILCLARANVNFPLTFKE